MTERSPKPEFESAWWNGFAEDWKESDNTCHQCGMLMWREPWWDDPEVNGGACVGETFECGNCGHWRNY